MISISKLNETLIAHKCLRALNLRLVQDSMTYELSMSISKSEQDFAEVVCISFLDISQLSAKELGGGLTQLMHMRVHELDSGLDRVRYELSDLEDGKLSFYFSRFCVH